MSNNVPKAAVNLLARKTAEWKQSLPPILQMEVLKGSQKNAIKKQFLRSGVDWVWDKPKPICWSYYLPVPGRRSDRKPRVKALRIAEAMQNMPDMIAEHRDDRRKLTLQKRAEYKLNKERDNLIEAASTRLTDMRDLVKEYDILDDAFFDGDDNYYKLLNDKHTSINNNTDMDNMDNTDDKSQKITATQRRLNRRKQRSAKFAEMIKNKPLLSEELDTLQEKLDKSREWEKLDPEDGDYDDGRTWTSRRSEKELAYIQQLANEPNLEKEQQKHDKRRVTKK